MIFADAEPGLTAGLFASLLANAGAAVAVWMSIRRGRLVLSKEEQALSKEERDDAIKQWRDFAKGAVAANAAAIGELKQQVSVLKEEIAESRDREMKCEIARAEQAIEIRHLKDQVAELRTEIQQLLNETTPDHPEG